MNEIEKRINDIIKLFFDQNYSIESDKTFVEMGINSLQYINIIVEVENEFSIEFPDDFLQDIAFKTIRDFCEYFNKLTENKIVIYISHRLAASHFCDNIMVLRNGKIIERGSHDQLMNVKGHYYDMYMRQAENYAEKEISL